MKKVKVGILGLQGAIEEHHAILLKAAQDLSIGIEIVRLLEPDQLDDIDGIVMPGGESTAMILMGKKNGMLDAVLDRINSGIPVFGTCAGAILLSKHVRRVEASPETSGAFPFLDIHILRNGYGRQVDSFSIDLEVKDFEGQFRGIFIRAPLIKTVADDIEILAYGRGAPVFIKSGNIMATTFHPELTEDTRIHQQFLNLTLANQ